MPLPAPTLANARTAAAAYTRMSTGPSEVMTPQPTQLPSFGLQTSAQSDPQEDRP